MKWWQHAQKKRSVTTYQVPAAIITYTGMYIHTNTSARVYTSAVKPLAAGQTYLKLMSKSNEQGGKQLLLPREANSSLMVQRVGKLCSSLPWDNKAGCIGLPNDGMYPWNKIHPWLLNTKDFPLSEEDLERQFNGGLENILGKYFCLLPSPS